MDVWWCHRVAVDVFLACKIDGIGTMAGIHWSGIAASELRAGLLVRRVPHRDWPEVGEDVRFMGNVVAAERNRRQEAASKRGRKG